MSETPAKLIMLWPDGNHVSSVPLEKAEDEIRYWLGKSPGIHRHEMTHIFVIPESSIVDRIDMVEKVNTEEAEFQQERANREERVRYEQLKKKFES